ncbi:MAG: alanine racemase [Phycisphaerae bacterium]|nr:alanine racemase [Phycisphaerae bacterium]
MNSKYLFSVIDPLAIEHNCHLLRDCAPNKKMCVAIKANAYGHDVRIVLPVFEKLKIDMLAVACIEEADELRNLGWKHPILLLGSELSVYPIPLRRQYARFLIDKEIRVTATNQEDLQVLADETNKLHKPAYLHIAFDSGMSRMGLSEKDAIKLIQFIKIHSSLVLEGLYTHFATADCSDKTFALTQFDRFMRLCEKLKNAGIEIPIIHCANSGATIDLPQSHLNMVRPGICVYGYQAGCEMNTRLDLRPSMKLISYLTLVKKIPAGSFVGYSCTFQTQRETTIGIVPIGYADGYFRELSNRGQMIIADSFVPVIGRVSMDQTIIDLTDLTLKGLTPKPGDEVIIYDNRPQSPNSVEKTAELVGTIPYVVTTLLGRRVKRIPQGVALP